MNVLWRSKNLSGVVLGLFVGCVDPDRAERASASGADDESSDDGPDIDEAAILDEVMAYQDHLVRTSGGPERSETHADAASVWVWASENALDPFVSINPEDPTQSVAFDEGSILLKEHFDENGTKIGLTAMYKGPEGYDERGGGWYWVRVRGERVTHQGQVDWCISCHEAAHNSDFVVGFDKSN